MPITQGNNDSHGRPVEIEIIVDDGYAWIYPFSQFAEHEISMLPGQQPKEQVQCAQRSACRIWVAVVTMLYHANRPLLWEMLERDPKSPNIKQIIDVVQSYDYCLNISPIVDGIFMFDAAMEALRSFSKAFDKREAERSGGANKKPLDIRAHLLYVLCINLGRLYSRELNAYKSDVREMLGKYADTNNTARRLLDDFNRLVGDGAMQAIMRLSEKHSAIKEQNRRLAEARLALAEDIIRSMSDHPDLKNLLCKMAPSIMRKIEGCKNAHEAHHAVAEKMWNANISSFKELMKAIKPGETFEVYISNKKAGYGHRIAVGHIEDCEGKLRYMLFDPTAGMTMTNDLAHLSDCFDAISECYPDPERPFAQLVFGMEMHLALNRSIKEVEKWRPAPVAPSQEFKKKIAECEPESCAKQVCNMISEATTSLATYIASPAGNEQQPPQHQPPATQLERAEGTVRHRAPQVNV